jgi:hypothetical protein
MFHEPNSRLDHKSGNGRAGAAAGDRADGESSRPETAIREVRAGCIGRGHAGKTALFRAMVEGPIGEYFPSGLHVDVGDPREAARMIRDSEETRRILELSGLPPTLEASQIRYFLYDGDEQRVIYHMREVIGQILTHTLPDSDEKQQARYEDYLKALLDTEVLWAVLPVPPANPTARDKRRYANDLRLTSAYLREALHRRPTLQPCAVALVMTKLDTLFPDQEAARAGLSDEVLLEALGPLVNTVGRSNRVTDAAVIPVTAFGFGNATQRPPSPEPDNVCAADVQENVFADEPSWLLREGAALEPYNLSTLILWTLMFGLVNQEMPDTRAENEINALCTMLQDDLEARDHWLQPIKGQLAGEN